MTSTAGTSDSAEFALHAADALAGNLNLRRTLGRLVHLAVPRLGLWASLTVGDGLRVRQVAAGPSGPLVERTVAAVDLVALAQVRALAGGRPHHVPAATADLLEALGIPEDAAAALAGTGVTVVGLAPHAVEAGLLAVIGDPPPDEGELDGLARRGATAMAAAHVYEERSTLASTLRAALVPAPLPVVPGVDLGASYRPAQETTQIGGDFYDVVPRRGQDWTFSMGDVCGKGVEAAVLTGQVRQSLRTASMVTDDPAATLRLVNDTMIAGDGSNFVTVVHGSLTPGADGLTVRIAVGGHPSPLMLRGSEVTTVPVRGTIVGMLADVEFTAVDLFIRPGDLLLMYTDGATEARVDGSMLGVDPIARMLADCAGLTAQAVTERLMQLVLEYLGGHRHDDIAFPRRTGRTARDRVRVVTGSGTVAAAGPTAAFDRYWTALATGDAAAAVDVACRERADGVPLIDVLEGLVSAGQHEVGRRWAANEWGVAAEHRATSVSEEVVAALTAQLGRPAVEAGTVVVTCADGEWHSLPSRILSAVLREAGWSVTFLGASVPARHLTQLLHDLGPDLTALSCMIPTGLFQARQVVEVSRSMGVPVLVGGRGFGVDGSRGLRIGADAWAPDARTAVELLRSGSLPRFTDPAPPLVEPDLDSLRLRAARSELVAVSMAAVSNRMRDVAGYDDHQRARTEEDLGFIVDFLRAALFVDDPALFVDFVGWLVEILTPRSVPPGTVRGGLAVLSGVIADRVGPLPRAQRILHAGLDSIV